MIGCLLTTPNTLDIMVNPPSRLLGAHKSIRQSRVYPCARTSGRRSPAAPLLATRPCVACHHIHLADDLSVAQLKRRFDHDPAPVRILARLPECHPIPTDGGFPLDAVRRLLAEGCSQVLGNLPLAVELERGNVRGVGVDDAKQGVLGVEAEHEVRVASLDAEAQGLEVQSTVGILLRHVLHLPSVASERLCSAEETHRARSGPTSEPSWYAS